MILESTNLILIVNDNPDQLDMLKTLLEIAGYRVETASDGYEGLDLARTLRPNLVLSDVNMPRMNGIELCRSLRADPLISSTAIMLVSAECVDSKSAVEGLQAGADHYLEAPYDPMRMVAKVTRLMERKRADDELRRQKEVLQKIFDHIPVLVSFWDEHGRLKLVNREWERVRGWSLEEIRESTADILAESYPEPQEHQRARDFIHAATGEWEDFKTRARDGRIIDAMWAILRLSDGTSISIGQDITERKRAEEKLRRSEERYRELVENALDIIYTQDLDGNYTSLNRAGERITGYTREEVLRMNVADVVAPEYLEKGRQMISAKFADDSETVYDLELITKDGRRVALEVNSRLIYQDGVPAGIQGIARDITERKRSEEKLRRSESQLVEAQRLAGLGSWNWDIQNNKLAWSEELYRMYGVDPHEFTPTLDAFMRFLHPEDMDFVAREIDTAVKNLGPLNYQFRIVRRGGEVRTLHSRGKVVADEHGLPLRMYGAVQDVTERVLAEDRLKGSNEKLRALAARLQSVREEESLRIAREIHDELGGAMTGLKIDLAWVNKRIRDASDESVKQKIASMSEMIDDTIKTIRHISSELRPSILDDLGLAATIEWQTREFETRTEIRCRITSLAEDVSLDEARATAIFRIFQEILTNVMRHAQATLVEVSMHEQNGELILRVKDNGVGIRETDVADTNSLGLLGMRERALVFGGQISIEGSEGEGTTVTVRIPLK
jgi:PAS domain S-box-containing protein